MTKTAALSKILLEVEHAQADDTVASKYAKMAFALDAIKGIVIIALSGRENNEEPMQ